jgi:hypothetical protein
VNLGKGSFVEAQREVLEVLLNEPGLYRDVEGRVSVEHFEVGVYREIAEALFDFLGRGTHPELRDLLTQIESPQGGEVVMELEESGGRKGNFEVRLNDAVETIARHFDAIAKRDMRQGLNDDDTEALRRYEELLKNGGKGQRSPGVLRL